HLIRVIWRVRSLGLETHSRDGARNASGLFISLRLAGLGHDTNSTVLLHVRKRNLVECAHADAIAICPIVFDLHLRPRGESRSARGIVNNFRDLREIDFVRIANVEVGDGSIRYDVGCGATFGDDSLDPRLRTHVAAHGVDVVEQVDRSSECVASIPCCELVRWRAAEYVLDAVYVHAARAKARGSAACRA